MVSTASSTLDLVILEIASLKAQNEQLRKDMEEMKKSLNELRKEK